MSEYHEVVVVLPLLVTFPPVTGEQDHVPAGVVQADVVPPDLPGLREHPVLVASLQYFTFSFKMAPTFQLRKQQKHLLPFVTHSVGKSVTHFVSHSMS